MALMCFSRLDTLCVFSFVMRLSAARTLPGRSGGRSAPGRRRSLARRSRSAAALLGVFRQVLPYAGVSQNLVHRTYSPRRFPPLFSWTPSPAAGFNRSHGHGHQRPSRAEKTIAKLSYPALRPPHARKRPGGSPGPVTAVGAAQASTSWAFSTAARTFSMISFVFFRLPSSWSACWQAFSIHSTWKPCRPSSRTTSTVPPLVCVAQTMMMQPRSIRASSNGYKMSGRSPGLAKPTRTPSISRTAPLISVAPFCRRRA